ncbi:metallophosphoesterase [Paenibacillus marinisediminis]
MKGVRTIISGLLMIAALVAAQLYIGIHGWYLIKEWFPNTEPLIYWFMFMLIAFAYAIGVVPWPRHVRPAARLFKVIGSYYLAVLEFALILLPIVDVAYWILKLTGKSTAGYVSFAGGIVVIILIAVLLWGSRNAWSTAVRRHSIVIEKEVPKLSKLRVAVASDIHLGNIVGNRHLKRLVNRINEMEPDLVLLPGDVLDDSIEPFLRNRMQDTLKGLKAKHGVYAVLGNHEYYGRSIKQYSAVMNEIGIRVLQDEVVEIADSYYVIGRKDRTAERMDARGRKSIAALTEGLDQSSPIIAMDHQPNDFGLAAEAGVDLLLCGHTHRGQFVPNHFVTRRMFELDWGYMLKKKMHAVVSSGYGTWGPPIRLGSRSEIVELNISFK